MEDLRSCSWKTDDETDACSETYSELTLGSSARSSGPGMNDEQLLAAAADDETSALERLPKRRRLRAKAPDPTRALRVPGRTRFRAARVGISPRRLGNQTFQSGLQ